MAIPLDYAGPSLRRCHSFYSWASLVMAVVTVAWVYYVQFERPPYHMGGPFWETLWDNALWPGGIGLALAAVGLSQRSRKRVLSIVAIVANALAYVLLTPPMNFA